MSKNSIVIALAALLVGIAVGWGVHAAVGGASDGAQVASPAAAPAASSAQEAQRISSDEAAEVGQNPGSAEASGVQGASSAEGAPGLGSSALSAQGASPPAEASSASSSSSASTGTAVSAATVVEDGTYTSKDQVAAYIHEFGHLPSNYISKSKAKAAGWVSNKGNLDDVLPGMSIGGSQFYNDEGRLPDAPGRTWTECDINYEGGYRGAERIVFSNDGLIFYTADHYETFEQLY